MITFAASVKATKVFVDSLKKGGKFAQICDSDPDGIDSAVIVSTAIERMVGIKPALVMPGNHNVDMLDDNLIADLKAKGITHLITTDIAFDQKKSQIKKLEKFCYILIFDHHKLYNNVNSKRTLLIKPQLFQKKIDPSQYCASKLVFDVFVKIAPIKDLDWLAVIGILADSNFRTWKVFVKKTLTRLKLKLNPEAPFNNSLGRICNLMAYYEIYAPGKVDNLYVAMKKAKSYKHALGSEIRKAEFVSKEVDYYLKNYQRYSENHDDLLLIRIKPKYRIGSIVATRLSNHLPHRTIVIAQEMQGRMFVSARRQDFKVAVNDLLEHGVKSINESSAGGHIPAAGARFPTTQYNTFSQRIILETKKKRSNSYK